MLLATPLTTRSIVWGKWLGAYCTVPLLAVLPVLVASALLWRSSRVGAWLALAALVLGQGVAVTSLGLAVTTWIARLGRALAVSVTLLVLVTILPFLALLTTHNRETEWIAVLSPFFGPGELTAMMEMSGQNEACAGWAVIWSVVYLAAGFGLFIATLVTFDRCMGRITKGRPQAADHWSSSRE